MSKKVSRNVERDCETPHLGKVNRSPDTLSNFKCSNCGIAGSMFKCLGCEVAFYCNERCQARHWNVHVEKCPWSICFIVCKQVIISLHQFFLCLSNLNYLTLSYFNSWYGYTKNMIVCGRCRFCKTRFSKFSNYALNYKVKSSCVFVLAYICVYTNVHTCTFICTIVMHFK